MARMEAQERSRKQDVNKRSAVSTVHDISSEIINLAKQKEQETMQMFMSSPNVLNTQLEATEAGMLPMHQSGVYPV